MARQKGNPEHGTVQRYRQGNCDGNGNRCEACKRAMSIENKNARAGMSAEDRRRVNNVTSIEGRTRSNHGPRQSNSQPSESNQPRIMGANERWVREQFEPYRAEHGARVELLITLASVMDNRESIGIWPTTSRQMDAIIDKILAKKKTKSGGRLATVSAMAGRKSG